MTDIFSILLLGVILGVEHAMEPDHLITVSILVSERQTIRVSALLGMIWGVGHTTTLLIIGSILLVTKFTIPSSVVNSLEFLVGIMIIGLGLSTLRKVWQVQPLHNHIHEHIDGTIHRHVHTHANTAEHNHHHPFRQSFCMGILHGGAGSAALSLLVLATVDHFLSGVLYIIIFGIGSILGMLVLGSLVSLPMQAALQSSYWRRMPSLLAGGIGIFIGGMIVVQQLAILN